MKLLARLPLPAAVLLLAVMVAATAYAQGTPPPPPTNQAPPQTTEIPAHTWTFTGFIGPGFGGGLQGSALSLGVAGGYNFTDHLGAEAEIGYARQRNSTLLDVRSNTFDIAANGLYYFTGPAKKWVPYATFGLDLLHGSATVSSIATTGGGVGTSTTTPVVVSQGANDFGINVGAGVKTRLARNLKFRGDIRYFNGGTLSSFWRIYGGLTFDLARH